VMVVVVMIVTDDDDDDYIDGCSTTAGSTMSTS
jgi:hypothetical protein